VNQNDIAYIAGLFDGEGSVSYYQRKEKQKNKKKAYNYWVIRCEMSMTDQYVMEWFYKTLDVGTLTKRLPTKSWVGRKMQWRWRCGYRDAYSFAKIIWPHTQVKLHKIEQIIDHYNPEYNTAKVVSLEDYR
jgi:hypothetical protein|tara:strand:- start:251 stop:643 length:393 start_codon:yes stop_codon:yes gene_type:complete